MKLRALITLSIVLSSIQLSYSQGVKVEKEARVKITQVPEQSVAWLNSVFAENLRVKWLKETTSGKVSYEAKFKYKKKEYSVEFSEEGAFEDIEFLVKWKSLSSDFQQQLLTLLKDFEKIKVKRFQKQWTSTSSSALKEAIASSDPGNITERYELVFQGKSKDKYHIWEALLSENELISIREVQLRSTANLDF